MQSWQSLPIFYLRLGKTMAGRKRSLLEKFISSLASATAGDETQKKGHQVVPAGTYKNNAPGAMPSMTGTGMAAKAGRALAGRDRQIEEQSGGLIGR